MPMAFNINTTHYIAKVKLKHKQCLYKLTQTFTFQFRHTWPKYRTENSIC